MTAASILTFLLQVQVETEPSNILALFLVPCVIIISNLSLDNKLSRLVKHQKLEQVEYFARFLKVGLQVRGHLRAEAAADH